MLLESDGSDGSDLDEDESEDDAGQSDTDIESESDGDNLISVESWKLNTFARGYFLVK